MIFDASNRAHSEEYFTLNNQHGGLIKTRLLVRLVM